MNRAFLMVSFLVMAACWPLAASSEVIVRHLGANNPLLEGFSLNFRGDVQLGPVANDLDRDSWMIWATTHDNGASYYYLMEPSESEMARELGWQMSATMRFVDLTEFTRAFLLFQDGAQQFRIQIFMNGGNLTISGGGESYIIEDNRMDYHEYALIYEAASETASLWIDGVRRLSGITGLAGSGPSRFSFGATGEAITHSYWHEVTFAIVPEPAAVGVGLGLGALAGAFFLRRRIAVRRVVSK